ncbi:Fe-S cluster assembly protein SufD [Marinomonas balearica]|uniref:Iron-regulated ABC transporter permease protein SufD n=1 Tax=Marinomonas balearica TaxID=491947 RepID=A0A4R6MDS6_9GAMM|nr:Fe-S cluster assembly protein SufD [Marinomonas balearica]TDO99375.1 iron-regulated ABC transporter permease protein SufD [Marinomonas balearica]
MSEWFSNALIRAQDLTGLVDQQWMDPVRTKAITQLKNTAWPNRKTEAWRYTPLRSVERTTASVKSTENDLSQLAPVVIPGIEPIEVVFIDGRYCAALSSGELPEGLSIVLGSKLEARDELLDKLSAIKPERHLFGMLNDALAQDVVWIKVGCGVSIDTPIRISNLSSQSAESHVKAFVSLEEGAQATILEMADAEGQTLSTGFTEYDLAKNARLEHYRFALQTGDNVSVGGSHFKLEEGAQLNSNIIGFGSDLQRLDTDIIYAGENANAKLNAIYLLDGKELFDLHATVEHAVPNCVTEENIRGIVADRARAVFNGRIHIHRDAQKTLAELNNRNLLLSDKAEINTKPELEIYADDVRCAHGATVAEIDKKALYYLQTRGISRAKAQVMLNFGFINELIDQMPNEVIAEWVRPMIRSRFEQMEVK